MSRPIGFSKKYNEYFSRSSKRPDIKDLVRRLGYRHKISVEPLDVEFKGLILEYIRIRSEVLKEAFKGVIEKPR
jgi:hypothetical protein